MRSTLTHERQGLLDLGILGDLLVHRTLGRHAASSDVGLRGLARLPHLTRVVGVVIGLVGADRNATWLGLKPASPWAGDGEPATAQAATERLDQAYGRFRSAITEVEPAALLEPLGPIGGAYARDTRLAFVLHELDELIHHGAEVGTMRDLYRALHPA